MDEKAGEDKSPKHSASAGTPMHLRDDFSAPGFAGQIRGHRTPCSFWPCSTVRILV